MVILSWVNRFLQYIGLFMGRTVRLIPASLIQVRHECAEAIGSVATPDAIRLLASHTKDQVQVVRESCKVALDMAEHEVSGQLQYADTLAKIKAASGS